MPRERTEPVRPGGYLKAEKFFILSFEGEKSEPKYFENIRNSELFNNSGLIETIPLKREKNTGTNPLAVKKLLRIAKSEYNFKPTDEFWLIIDRDHWETIHNIDFDKLIAECEAEKNFYLAMSNPCFEIWLILHLKNVTEFSEEELSKISINQKISNKKHHIDTVLENLIGDGRGYNKTPNPEEFLPLTNNAIERAKALSNPNEKYPTSIGTDVYKLVEKLIIQKQNK